MWLTLDCFLLRCAIAQTHNLRGGHCSSDPFSEGSMSQWLNIWGHCPSDPIYEWSLPQQLNLWGATAPVTQSPRGHSPSDSIYEESPLQRPNLWGVTVQVNQSECSLPQWLDLWRVTVPVMQSRGVGLSLLQRPNLRGVTVQVTQSPTITVPVKLFMDLKIRVTVTTCLQE